jgi:oligosaccharide repeat unit polymerase
MLLPPFFIGIAVLILIGAFFLRRNFFSPVTVFAFSQTATMGVAWLKLDRAMTDFNTFTWVVLLTGGFSFILGAWVTRLLYAQMPVSIEENSFQNSKLKSYNWSVHHAFSWFAFFIFLLGVWRMFQLLGGVPLFSQHITTVMHRNYSLGYWGYALVMSPAVIMLFGVASFKKINPYSHKVRIASRIMVLVTMVVNILSYPGRGILFINIGLIIIYWNFARKRVSPLLILFFFMLGASAFVGIAQVRSQYATDEITDVAVEAMVKLPYQYVSNNYWNLDYALNPNNHEYSHPHTWGFDFMSASLPFTFTQFSMIEGGKWDDSYNLKMQKKSGLNTVHFLWQVYKDWHLPGVILYPFFAGILLSWLYQLLRSRVSVMVLVFYSFSLYIVGWWFFSEFYRLIPYWVWAYYIFMAIFISQHFPWGKKEQVEEL